MAETSVIILPPSRVSSSRLFLFLAILHARLPVNVKIRSETAFLSDSSFGDFYRRSTLTGPEERGNGKKN